MSDSDATPSSVTPEPALHDEGGENAPADSTVSYSASVDESPSSSDDRTTISQSPPAAPRGKGKWHPFEIGSALEGEMLDHFLLEEFVGGGGMGAVFRGLDTLLNRTVAVKVVSIDEPEDDNTRRRFRNEAQSAARLDHDNIARIHHVGEACGVHYIVLEFIDGVNVRDLVGHQGPLPLRDVVNYTLQIAEALDHANQRDVVHRDIKPSNVIITAEGHVKLVDMGLARLHQIEPTDSDLTASGVTLGTFDYISPEQARDPRTADVRSDLYSLGCTFYFMLTGKPPFPEGTMLQKLLKHQGDEAPDPRSIRPELPDEVSAIADKMLAKAPKTRYQEPRELIVELIGLAEKIGLPTARTVWVPMEREDSFVRRNLPWIASIALLLMAVLGLEWYRRADDVPYELAATSNAVGARQALDVGESTSSPRRFTETNPQEDSGSASAAVGDPRIPRNASTSTAGAIASDERRATGEIDSARISKRDPIPSSVEERNALANGVVRRNPSDGSAGVRASTDADRGFASPEAAVEARNGNASSERSNRHAQDGAAPVDTLRLRALPERMGTLVVAPEVPKGSVDHVFPTLRAACGAARSGEVIELRYNGRREEKPILLADVRLSIRAGDGFQPHVVFRPVPREDGGGRQPVSMFTLTGGELRLLGVHLEMDLSHDVHAARWSLLEAQGVNRIHVEDSWLTIRNVADDLSAYHPHTSFINIRAEHDRSLPVKVDGERVEKSIRIYLENCIARGEATFLECRQHKPVRVAWKNGLLATSERFLEIVGDPLPSPSDGNVQVDLRHLTVAARRGLVYMDRALDTSEQPQLEFKTSNSILMAGSDAALVELQGGLPIDEMKGALVWNGDRNFYEGVDAFWRNRDTRDERPEQVDFDSWQEYWNLREDGHEDMPYQNAVVWKNGQLTEKPFHERVVADYELSDRDAENPALGIASDEGDVGFWAHLLPPLPHEPAPIQATPPESDPDEDPGIP